MIAPPRCAADELAASRTAFRKSLLFPGEPVLLGNMKGNIKPGVSHRQLEKFLVFLCWRNTDGPIWSDCCPLVPVEQIQ